MTDQSLSDSPTSTTARPFRLRSDGPRVMRLSRNVLVGGTALALILICGAVPQVPRALLDQLKDGGRLVAVVADGSFGRVTQWRRLGGTFDSRVICEAGAPKVAGFEKAKEFVF